MRVLFLFLDGVGLGSDNPLINPMAAAEMPFLTHLMGGRRLLGPAEVTETALASLIPIDAGLGVPGLPQSATGQASLLSGRNIPALVGEHYGPKPNPAVAARIREGTIFKTLMEAGRRTALLNAYPPRYFEGVASGRRLYSAIPLAVTSAGIPLKTAADLQAGAALSADFTGQGWREHLGFSDTPLLTPFEAGQKLAALSEDLAFAFFEYWLTDYAGHHQDMPAALGLLSELDQVLAGLTEAWNPHQGLVLVTSDHGNLEDLSTRRHTANPVPCLLLGDLALRQAFTHQLTDLTGIAPAILRLLG